MVGWHRIAAVVTPALIGGLVAACQGMPAGGDTSSPEARMIWQSGQCGARSAGSRWIGDPAALERAVRASGPASPDADEPDMPSPDFERRRVLLVALGERPTAGYGIGLERETLEIQGDTAVLRVAVTRPPADSMQAQVITAPCMLVTVEPADYSTLAVRASDGADYGTLTVD